MLLQHAAGGWGLLVYLHLVPPLLKEVGSVVVSSIGVTKCNVFQVVAHQLSLIISEIITHHLGEQRMSAGQHINKHRLAAAVRPHNGQLFAFVQNEVNGFSHPPLRHSCDTFFYSYDGSHCFTLFGFRTTKSFQPRYEACDSGLPDWRK